MSNNMTDKQNAIERLLDDIAPNLLRRAQHSAERSRERIAFLASEREEFPSELAEFSDQLDNFEDVVSLDANKYVLPALESDEIERFVEYYQYGAAAGGEVARPKARTVKFQFHCKSDEKSEDFAKVEVGLVGQVEGEDKKVITVDFYSRGFGASENEKDEQGTVLLTDGVTKYELREASEERKVGRRTFILTADQLVDMFLRGGDWWTLVYPNYQLVGTLFVKDSKKKGSN